MMTMRSASVAIAAVLLMAVTGGWSRAQDLEFESLGVPVMETGHGISFVTEHPDGHYVAWDRHETPDFMGLLGVRLDSGEYFTLDLSQWGSSHVTATVGPEGDIYAYCGRPAAHFVRIDPATLEVTDLGAPAENAHYFAQGAKAPDGRFYVGTYPRAALVWVDTNTGEIGTAGRMTDDERNRYLWASVAVSDDNIVYCPVGLHHQELYAYDPATGEATQILPEELMELPHSPRLWTGTDGEVYGRSGGTRYRCTPTGIVTDCEIADARGGRPQAGEWLVGGIDTEGALTLTHAETGETRTVQTQYRGRPVMIYSVCTQWQGRVWGGTGFPARVFSVDPETGETEDHGRQSGGRIQIYDIIGTPEGLLLSSYTGAHLNLWNPLAPEGEEDNQALERGHHQERPIQWTQGPDGNWYIGTRPIKGHVGGGLCRVTLDPLEATWWINPIGEQSVMGCAPVPETGELLCATSNYGGSSSIPTEPVGHIFLWDCDGERVAHIDEPVEGARSYSAPVRARTGIVYGISYGDAGRQLFGYDPVKRETVHVGELPGERPHFPSLHGGLVGPDGLIIGLADDAVFAIDPADHSTRVLGRHESIAEAHGFMITDDGVLYYGSGAELWRCRLPLQ
ncbi:MAG: hypothetical protein U9R79_12040 [Armatimonadota bacterium]|nr:hypothetical protein [Armatimonadota bacterium]